MRTAPDLETDLHDLIHMAHITATLLENSLDCKAVQKELTGKPDTYYLSEDDANAMLFASYEVHTRLKALREKYLRGRGIEN